MEYRNETERKVLEQLQGSANVWKRLSKQPLKISLVLTDSKIAYAIYNNGRHTGAFIPGCFINDGEVKELKWKKVGEALSEDQMVKHKLSEHRVKKKCDKNK